MAKADYKEILKLRDMLEQANIPFKFIEHNDFRNGYQIIYPETDAKLQRCSVIEHSFSYGHEADKLEIMGLLTSAELQNDNVAGYLSADNVFERIRKDYETQKSNN